MGYLYKADCLQSECHIIIQILYKRWVIAILLIETETKLL